MTEIMPVPRNLILLSYQQGAFPHCVIPTAAPAEWRNPPRWRKDQRKRKSATWEDSSTHIRSLGMTCRGGRFVRTGCIRGVSGTAHRPFPTVSLGGCTSAPIVPAIWNAARPSQSPSVTALPEGEPRCSACCVGWWFASWIATLEGPVAPF